MFAIGDYIIYPMHGAGLIMDMDENYYEICILEEDIHIRIAKKNAARLGLRYPLSKADFQKELEQAENVVLPQKGHWLQQYQEYLSRLKSGRLREVAAVILSIEEKEKQKPLSSTESRLLHWGRQIVESEKQLIAKSEEILKNK